MDFIQDLSQHPERYDFDQAMRLLSAFNRENVHPIKVALSAEVMPTGTASPIEHFSLKNNQAKMRLAVQALSGVKGVIPNYIYEQLLASLHQEDHALKEFLDVFNQRHFELVNKAKNQTWLLLEHENAPDKVALIRHLASLKEQHQHYLQYLPLLGHKSRHLGTMQQMLNDYFSYTIQVSCTATETKLLAPDSLTRIGSSGGFNNQLGQGFLLGKYCEAQFSHLSIYLLPNSRAQFNEIKQDQQLAPEIHNLVHHYIRDATPISIYINVKRGYLLQPTLSSNPTEAARLGEVDCLAPQRRPEEMVKILMN